MQTTQPDISPILFLPLGIGLLVAIFMLYFLPTLTARSRGNPDASAILAVNILLGWTFIGWVIALVWAYKGEAKKKVPKGTPSTPAWMQDKPCPQCAENVKYAALKCRFCGYDFPPAG